MQRDPVCGMQVNEKTAAGKSEYQGKTYYFCSIGCKRTFDQSPSKFVEAKPAVEHSGYHI